MAILIDTEGISDGEKQTAKFKRAYQEMYDHLSAFGHVVCCHEAAHIFYFTMAGMKNYDAFPAKIYYDPKIDDYGGTLASIQPCDLKMATTEKEAQELLWTVMKAHAAGGVVARKLMPSLPDHGDGDDKNRFMELCKEMKVTGNPEDLWKQAQEAVSKELTENPKVFAGLQKFAEEELRPRLGLS